MESPSVGVRAEESRIEVAVLKSSGCSFEGFSLRQFRAPVRDRDTAAVAVRDESESETMPCK